MFLVSNFFCLCSGCIDWRRSVIDSYNLRRVEPKHFRKVRRGVRSGNTLRAFSSLYCRRYHRQACIVSRAQPALLQRLREGTRGGAAGNFHASPPSTIFAVDVPLSLNKRYRWLMPPELIRQIESDDIELPDLTVSLLERHKLHRPGNNCAGFHSNSKGEVRRVKPRGGRYFGFNFSTNGGPGRSARAARRERRVELLRQSRKEHSEAEAKLVEVSTELGAAWKNLDVDLEENEVRYEVFYPAPACCSISYNPKYIKYNMPCATGNRGKDIRNPGRAKPQKRKKWTTLRRYIDAESERPIAASEYRYHVARYDCDQVLDPFLYDDDVGNDNAYDDTDNNGVGESKQWLVHRRYGVSPVKCSLSCLIKRAKPVKGKKRERGCQQLRHHDD